MRLLPYQRAELSSPLSAAEVRKRISALIEERARSGAFVHPDSPFEDLTQKPGFKPFFGALNDAGFRLLLRAPDARMGGRRAVSVVIVGEVHAKDNETRIAARVGLSAGNWLYTVFSMTVVASFASLFRPGRAPEPGGNWAIGALAGTLYWFLVLALFGDNARRALGILSKTLECTDQVLEGR